MTDILIIIALVLAASIFTTALFALGIFCMSLYDIIFCHKSSSRSVLIISFLMMVILPIPGVQLILLAKKYTPQTREIHLTVPEKAKVNAQVIYSDKVANISDL